MSTDTEALRALAKNLERGGFKGGWQSQVNDALRQAADDLDRLTEQRDDADSRCTDEINMRHTVEKHLARLREAFEAAPHEFAPDMCPDRYGDECTCWKADALKIGETE